MYFVLKPNVGLPTVDEQGRALQVLRPQWDRGSEFSVEAFLSLRSNAGFRSSDMVRVARAERLEFTEDCAFEVQLNVSVRELGPALWGALGANRTLYTHFRFAPLSEGETSANRASASGDELWVSAPAVRFVHEEPKRPRRFLCRGWPLVGWLVPEDPPAPAAPASGSELLVGFWKPVASAHIVGDWTHWPAHHSPATVLHHLSVDRARARYRPVLYTDQLGLTKEKLVQVNRTNEVLPLSVVVGSMSLARWQFNAHMEQTLALQRQLGASDKDIDDMRHMLTETEPTLLAVTVLVSVVHIALDVLAFKSDINFWQGAKSTRGLSVKSLATDLACQVIIAAYLHEQSASLLLLGPSAVGVLVQLWKVSRAYRIGGAGAETEASDSLATRALVLVLAPLVLAYTLYSLVFEMHTGVYGWAVGSLASSVYALGFVMMTPQIFINYKLKSVAHLPWKFFVYKAMNTFIDDLFAFIIRMPAMHRLSVFRDDLVFFIYMYQRYIYPVDRTRKADTGDEDDEAEDAKERLVVAPPAQAPAATKKTQ
jgi:hypothetical protein